MKTAESDYLGIYTLFQLTLQHQAPLEMGMGQ